ncbi:CPS_collapsed_G0003320.mRNA.1.CDS.1 [Saccharomyces cerevisiae]|nr:CPS_collapsed_G0003320.mRNA.1.CDS.1 [Saccharomyces cerevisiae]
MDLKDVLKRNDEKIKCTNPGRSNNADTLSSNNAQDMLPIKMVKLRKTPNTNDSSSNGNSSNNKRRVSILRRLCCHRVLFQNCIPGFAWC